MDEKTKRILRWNKADKIIKNSDNKCSHEKCNAKKLAILDEKDEPGIICYEHYVNGKECINNCGSPEIVSGLCRQCLIGNDIPSHGILQHSPVSEFGKGCDVRNIQKFNKIISKKMRSMGIPLDNWSW